MPTFGMEGEWLANVPSRQLNGFLFPMNSLVFWIATFSPHNTIFDTSTDFGLHLINTIVV